MPVVAPIVAGVAASAAGYGALATAAIVGGTSALATKLSGGSWGDAFKSGVTSGAMSFAGSTLLGGISGGASGSSFSGSELAASGLEGMGTAAESALQGSGGMFGSVGDFAGRALNELTSPVGMLKAGASALFSGVTGGGGSKQETSAASGELIRPNFASGSLTSDSPIAQRARSINAEASNFAGNPDALKIAGNPVEQKKLQDTVTELSKKNNSASNDNEFFRNVFATSLMKNAEKKFEPSQFAMYNKSDLVFSRLTQGVA